MPGPMDSSTSLSQDAIAHRNALLISGHALPVPFDREDQHHAASISAELTSFDLTDRHIGH